jgi:peroxiredoxin
MKSRIWFAGVIAGFLMIVSIVTKAATETPIVQLAPDFSFRDANGHISRLKSLRGKPVILLIAPSAGKGRFRREVKTINRASRSFTSRKAVLVAAFVQGGEMIRGESPFVLATDASHIATAYGIDANSYGLIVIGPDGNLDLRSTRVLSAQKIIDAIDNSYVVQARRKS